MKIKICLIGCGAHAKRIYIPFIKSKKNCELSLVIDLEENKKEITNFLHKNKLKNTKTFFIKKENFHDFSSIYEKKLIKIFENLEIKSVIISSEPLSHKKYLLFCIQNNYNTLIDKPITLHSNIFHNKENALKLISDYDEIIKEYKKSKCFVSCMSQRRYHSAINIIKKEINYYHQNLNIIPHSIIIQHADGQFRTPKEIKDIEYHGFNEGYGKCGHSGYHFFDLAFLYSSNFLNYKQIDNIEAYSTFFNASEYTKIINESKINPLYKSKIKNISHYGEHDANINYSLSYKNIKKTNIHLSLLHNSLTSRHSIKLNKDLYKGNGRIRHETHIINIGPFCTIYYNSYQSKEFFKNNYGGKIGEEGHSEVLIFRNNKLHRRNRKTLEKFDFSNKGLYFNNKYSRGHQEEARYKCFTEFINKHKNKRIKLKSDITQHYHSIILMSLAYLSKNKVHNYEV